MKTTFLTLMLGACAFTSLAQAADSTVYDYSQHLDIAKVIDAGTIPDVCAVVPVKMVYEDSRGQRHTLQYQVMGKGCYE